MNDNDGDGLVADGLIAAIHMIVCPGEYGLGNEAESLPTLTDKECLVEIGKMIEEYWSVQALIEAAATKKEE